MRGEQVEAGAPRWSVAGPAAQDMPPSSHQPKPTSPITGIAIASATIAVVAAILSVTSVSLFPPRLEDRPLTEAGATTQVLVDLPRSKLADRFETWNYLDTMRTRAALTARLMTTPPALKRIGARAGVLPERIAAFAPVTADVEGVLTEPGSEQRARELRLAALPYRLEAHARPDRPVVDLYAQAPTADEAERLATGAIEGMRDYLRALATRQGFDPDRQVRLHQLGPARSEVLTAGADLKIAALTFALVFGLAFAALLAVVRMRTRAPRTPRDDGVDDAAGGEGGDWPRTTRVLPWMLAAFTAVVWLVPIDSIELQASLPIDLKFDRLVMPFLVVAWIGALIVARRGGPRLRASWIHVALGAFVTVAFLSVVLDAAPLNQALELDTSLKKLPLLVAYASLFVIAASTLRRSEVAPFLNYILLLAVICALGTLWEYRFQHNLFFEWSDALLPGAFEVTQLDSGWDFSGRRVTHGPAMHGLVAVAMLAMALPIALVNLIQSKRWRGRILYGLAACVLMAAMFATQRKTGLVAPIAVIAVLAYFRRRELLRMAPAAAVALIAVLVVSPGTITPTLSQFQPDQLDTNTVSDRASDYDAIRPDVWSKPAFGRGYGSYQPVGHRILDSEVLVRTVETGALGLLAFVLLPLAVVGAARGAIRSRDPARSPPALAGAAAAVAFFVVAFLFDTMSYPQVPYIFLGLAALVAVVTVRDERRPPDSGSA